MSSMSSLLQKKDYITLCGAAFGFLAVVATVIGTRSFIVLGFVFVFCALITDMLDGYVARKTGTANEIGTQIDSLSDSLSFGVAPAILTFQSFRTGGVYDIFIAIGCICFVIGAFLRLARFNLSDNNAEYTGVPTPLTAICMLLFFAFSHSFSCSTGACDFSLTRDNATPIYIGFAIAAPFIAIACAWFNITTHMRARKEQRSIKLIGTSVVVSLAISAILALLLQVDQLTSFWIFVGLTSLSLFIISMGFIVSMLFNES